MQILLANAKIMFDKSDMEPWTKPVFQSIANDLAREMASCDTDTLAKELDCSRALAVENWRRYQNFFQAEKLPAILAYNGQAYKHLKGKTLSEDALTFGQEHLWITCFLYGLLRPMDGIVPYRMEHCVKLAITDDKPIHTFWKDTLTDVLIESAKADDGILVHLSTEEYEHLFDWKRVCREVTVIHPLFYVRQKDGGLKMQAVWAKSCRGAMVRFILNHQITQLEELQTFCYEGFAFNPKLGEELFPHFVREDFCRS
ncbi:MAG: YaaA family protein [Bacteroidales bacterium]|nr:YaaA family protein [Candidatus Physcousia equi]